MLVLLFSKNFQLLRNVYTMRTNINIFAIPFDLAQHFCPTNYVLPSYPVNNCTVHVVAFKLVYFTCMCTYFKRGH